MEDNTPQNYSQPIAGWQRLGAAEPRARAAKRGG
jgi:hypothetical protein